MVRLLRYLTTYLEAMGLHASSPANDVSISASFRPMPIEDFTFRGMGCCANSEGSLWSYTSIPQAESIADFRLTDCAVACEKEYGPEFAGINYRPGGWYGSAVCNCMMDAHDRSEGAITSVGGWCHDEYCYSYDKADTSSPANDAPIPAPAIEDFTFRGMGCCANSEGSFWSYNSIPQTESIADCAAACEEEYGPEFAGINYHPPGGWYGSYAVCNCMMETYDGSEGAITSAGGWCHDEYCYSYDKADIPMLSGY